MNWLTSSITINGNRWTDDARLFDLEPRFICKRCGQRRADIRPNFAPALMGTNAW
jgi:hypothetical protein